MLGKNPNKKHLKKLNATTSMRERLTPKEKAKTKTSKVTISIPLKLASANCPPSRRAVYTPINAKSFAFLITPHQVFA